MGSILLAARRCTRVTVLDPYRISWGPYDPTLPHPAQSVFGASGPVLVMATSARPSVESMEMIGARLAELRALHDQVFLLVVRETAQAGVGGGDPVPDGARRRAHELLNELAPSIAGIAYVYEGDGFISSIVRMSFRGLVFMAPVSTTVVATVDEGIAWITASPACVDGSPDTLRSLVPSLRSSLRRVAGPGDSVFPP